MEFLSAKDEIRRLLQRRAKTMGFTVRAVEVLVNGSDRPRSYRDGSRIVAAGDCADYIRLVVQGVAKLMYQPRGAKRTRLVQVFGPGDFLFLPPVGDPLPERLEIVAHGDTSVTMVTRAHLSEALELMPPSRIGQLVSWTARTAQHLMLRQVALSCFDVEGRIASEMAALARRFGERVTGGWLIDLELIHQDIADLAACSRARATRALGALERRRLVVNQGGRYWVSTDLLDWLSCRDADPEAA
jgi:CRP-like cAMP-binding protein